MATPITARTRTRPPATNVPIGAFLKGEFDVPTRPATTGRGQAENLDTPARKERMLFELERHVGIVYYACQAAGVPRSVHYYWVGNDPDYAAKVAELGGVALDYAEGQLFKNMREGREASVIFFLKTKGKARGYQDSMAITGADGGPIQIMSADQVKEELPLAALQKVLLQTVFKDIMSPEQIAKLTGAPAPVKQLPSNEKK